MNKIIRKIKGMEKNKKRILVVTILAIIALLTTLIVTSYAMLTKSDGSSEKDLFATGDMIVTFEEKSGSEITVNPAVPVTDEFGLTTNPYKFTIKNTGDYNASYTIKLVSNSTTTIDLSYIKYSINGSSPKLLSEIENNVILEGIVYKKESESFELRIWIDESATNGIDTLKYSGKIQLSGKAIKNGANPPKLADGMIPVTYDTTNDVWVKADTTSKWYDYDNQIWANAVTVDGCIPKGDINLDGVIDQTDVNIAKQAAFENDTGYTNEQLITRMDIDNDGEISTFDAVAISHVLTDNSQNLCIKPVKNPEISNTREYYESAEAGTEIVMDDINAMWVWIPRFKYKIATNLGSTTSLTSPPMIDVVFENGTEATGVTESVYRSGMSATSNATNTNYYTHPAFRDIDNITYSTDTSLTSGSTGAWDEELTGIWVGKFETSTNNNTCASSTVTYNDSESEYNAAITNCENVDPIIKPNVMSLRYQNVSTQFLTSLKFAGGTIDTSTGEVTFEGSNYYGLGRETDTHMMKNTEWGAVAILSQSQYGKMGNDDYTGTNKEIYQNKSTTYITGNSNGTTGTSTSIDTQCSYNDITNRDSGTGACGAGASTTGTIYGVYDMSGGSFEYTIGNWANIIGYDAAQNSGFNGLYYDGTTKTDGISMPNKKYYDTYDGTSSATTTREKSIMGDATWETMYWYADSNVNSVYKTGPWYTRGCSYQCSTNSGIFNMLTQSMYGIPSYNLSFRTTLIP